MCSELFVDGVTLLEADLSGNRVRLWLRPQPCAVCSLWMNPLCSSPLLLNIRYTDQLILVNMQVYATGPASYKLPSKVVEAHVDLLYNVLNASSFVEHKALAQVSLLCVLEHLHELPRERRWKGDGIPPADSAPQSLSTQLILLDINCIITTTGVNKSWPVTTPTTITLQVIGHWEVLLSSVPLGLMFLFSWGQDIVLSKYNGEYMSVYTQIYLYTSLFFLSLHNVSIIKAISK